MDMTHRQMTFAREYPVDFNATQAAIRAGYSKRSAYSTGHSLLKKPEIQKEIRRASDRAAMEAGVTLARVLKEIASIAFADILDYVEVSEDGRHASFRIRPGADTGAIRTIKTVPPGDRSPDEPSGAILEVTLHDRLRPLDMLMRHLGAYET